MLDFNPIDLCINKEDRLSPEELEKEYKIKGYSERLIKTVNKAGEDVDILISSAPIDSQTPSGNIVFTIMNISEQLRSKALLIESQERLNIIIQATKVGLWDWNLITDEFITDALILNYLKVMPIHDFIPSTNGRIPFTLKTPRGLKNI